MKQRMPWVKWSPADFLNGIVGLDPFAIAAYTVILNMIYDNGGPIRADDAMMRRIARRISMRFDHFQKAIETLSIEGKLVVADGVMSNPRAELELSSRASKVAKLVSNFSGGTSSTDKNGNHYNGSLSQMGEQIAEKTGTDKNQKENQKESKTRARATPPMKQAKSVRIDPHRKMSNGNLTFARGCGLTKREADFEWARFVRYYAGRSDSASNSKSPDWDSVWESWVLKRAHELGRDPQLEAGTETGDLTQLPREVWVRQVELWRKGVSWPEQFGPAPGSPGCLAPPDLVRPS